MERDEVIKMLKAKSCEITFTKVDGSIRNMIGTLNENVIKDCEKGIERKPSTRKISKPDNIVCVYDCAKYEWRSFRLENLVSIKSLYVDGN